MWVVQIIVRNFSATTLLVPWFVSSSLFMVFCSNVVKFCVMPKFICFCLHRFVFSWDFKWLFFRFPIGLLLLFWLSFSVCYCSGNNHSRSSLLDFCSCCWSSKIVGAISICFVVYFLSWSVNQMVAAANVVRLVVILLLMPIVVEATFNKRLRSPQSSSISTVNLTQKRSNVIVRPKAKPSVAMATASVCQMLSHCCSAA